MMQPSSPRIGADSLFWRQFPTRPLLIAHRGYRACYPENTLCSFAHSLGRCDMIELDVQLSRDGEVVVFHDEDLDRTSNGAALAQELGLTTLRVGDWSLAQLRRLDAGSWFLAADPFATLAHGVVTHEQLQGLMPQPIPTLRQVLRWAKDNVMPLNIEIKDMGQAQANERLAAAVLREIRAAAADPLILISSFNHKILRYCSQLAPEMALAALQEASHPPDLIEYLRTLGVQAYHPEDAITSSALVAALRDAGLRTHVFTVNERTRQQQLFAYGVRGVFTDFPTLPVP
jgi:glycerophosphoryl diester phosphodiesterase